MKKNLLLFIAALCATVAVKAETITLEPGEDKIANAIASASAGDIIELTGDADHVYTEWNHIVVDKTITLRAAEGATPLVKIHYVDLNASFEAEGIQFISHNTAYYWFQTTSGGDFNISFKSCQFTNCAGNYIYYLPEEQCINSLTIDDCIMDTATEGNNNRFLCTYGVIDNFTMINSTIMNHPGGYPCYVRKVNTSLLVDHCTFYNNGNRPLLLGDKQCPTDAVVKNSVVANPTVVDNYCIATYGGTVENCVYYNTQAPRSESSVNTNCINANPQFTNPANGDFSFALTSPLFLAATDGSHIGDPRWGVNVSGDVDITTELNISNKVCGTAQASVDDATLIEFYPSKKSSKDTALWAGWIVNKEALAYNVITNVNVVSSGWSLDLHLFDIKTGKEVVEKHSFAGQWGVGGQIDLGTWDLSRVPAGQYLLKVKNQTAWGNIQLKSLTFTAAGGSVVNLPGILPSQDAILGGNAKVKVDEEGYICFSEDGNVPNCYAKWNANFTKKGKFEVSLSVSTTNGHQLAIQVLDGENVISETTPKWLGASGNLVLGIISVPQQGNYTIKFINTLSSSAARVKDITLTYAGGGIVEIPGTLLPADAILSENAFIDNDTIIFAPRGSEGHTPDGWAKWNVTLEKDALCSFKANCHRFSGNTMKIKISVINSENDTIYQKEENVENSGDSEVALGNIMLAAGDYVIQMQNTVEFSSGRLMSVVVTAQPIITITDDSDIDFTDYAGQMVTVQLRRTFKANMWNPICLPFAVSDELFQQIFKSTKSFILSEASLENQKLFVKLAENYGIYQGTPVMVKPSEDVVNPIFENVEIITANPSSTTNGPLCLRGTFASHELENKENVLLVGANNTLFFPSDDAPHIKSMRAYFELQNVEPSQMPRFAAFIEPGNAPTEMIIVGGEAERQKGHRKVLVDGQIRIQHEGKCYSILGLER